MCKYDAWDFSTQLWILFNFINVYLLFLVSLGFLLYSCTHIKPMTPKPNGFRAPGGKTHLGSNMQVDQATKSRFTYILYIDFFGVSNHASWGIII